MIPLLINDKPYYNTDSFANTAISEMFDCYLEPVPGIGFVTRRRPGFKLFTDLGTGKEGQGLYYWEPMNLVIAVSGGVIYKIVSDGSYTIITGATLDENNPVTFAAGMNADGAPYLYMANGKLVYTFDGLTAAYPTDPATPYNATHVAWISGRFIANVNNSSEFWFTGVNPISGAFDPTYWSDTNNPVFCDAKGDKLSALFTGWQEIYAWGTEGLQIFQNDGVTPFSDIPSAFAEYGIEAKYSIAKCDNTIFALCVIDGKRSVVKLEGRQPTVVSEPISVILANMDTVSDAIGTHIGVGGITTYLLTFPSANQTWAYDFKNDTWSQWSSYFGESHSRDRFVGQCYTFCKTWNKHLMQSRIDGKIYELSRQIFTDETGLCIPYLLTGWHDCGSLGTRKLCTGLYVTGKPGTDGKEAKLLLRFRDDGSQSWTPFMELQFDRNMVEPLNRLGMFRARQYEFRIPDGMDTVLMKAAGEFKELRN